jgi:hypothetical protein
MPAYATPQEIIDAFTSLTQTEKRILHAVAAKHMAGSRFSDPLDLLHEALYLAVEGRRNWPRGLDFAVFLGMTARSVAFADRSASANTKVDARPVEDLLNWSRDGAAAAHPSAEACAERAQNWRRVVGRIKSARDRLGRRDPVAASVLEGIVAERAVGELRRELSLQVAEYDAARKRALRALRTIERL